MSIACSGLYRLRGHRVEHLTDGQIFKSAETSITRLKLNTPMFRLQIASLFELWWEKFGLTIDVVEDADWSRFTNGHYDPTTFTIRIPERVLRDIISKDSIRKREGLRVLFHELGHFCLAHKAVLHDSNGFDCKEVDSEEQADFFAEALLVRLGFVSSQMSLDF